MAAMKSRIAVMEDELEAYEDQVNAFSDEVEDERLMLILRFKFLRGMTWEEISEVTGITETTAKRLMNQTLCSDMTVDDIL